MGVVCNEGILFCQSILPTSGVCCLHQCLAQVSLHCSYTEVCKLVEDSMTAYNIVKGIHTYSSHDCGHSGVIPLTGGQLLCRSIVSHDCGHSGVIPLTGGQLLCLYE